MLEFMNGRVFVQVGDIASITADAIVNAANSTLLGGGGVDGALHRAGGPAILTECRGIRADSLPAGLPTGQAVATGAGHLSARHVIHTVGPVWRGGAHDEDRLLASSYMASLTLAHELGCASVAFPAVSTGVYGFPKDRAARIASRTVKDFLKIDTVVRKVMFVFFDQDDADIFTHKQVFGDQDS